MFKKLLCILLIICTAALCSCSDKFDEDNAVHRFSYPDASGIYNSFVSAGDFISLDEEGNNVISFGDATAVNAPLDMLNAVSSDPSSIGYISASQITGDVKALKLNGFMPTPENIREDKYELYHPLNLAYDENNISDGGLDFIRYIFSEDGQHIISKNGYVSFDKGSYYISSMPRGELTLYCSYSSYPIAEKLAKAYMNLVNDKLKIELHTSHTEECVASVGQSGGIAFISSEIPHTSSLACRLYSADGIAVIVNAENPTEDISLEQVKKIFSQNGIKWNGI